MLINLSQEFLVYCGKSLSYHQNDGNRWITGEEDAADQLAAYILLQYGESEARRLIAGTAYAYDMDETKTDPCSSMEDYANEHGTGASTCLSAVHAEYFSSPILLVKTPGHVLRGQVRECQANITSVGGAR